ncbi:MAG: hypothetical protein ABH818_00175 [Patescibacteria group bacterium]|nr:hypothetical protein [Patescibacteria group bacterium]MBU1870777.1 hypothetical protein [Patescibacteria group bacterium]
MITSFKIFKKLFFILIVVLFFVFVFSHGYIYKQQELAYGLTFSKKQAQSLGFDWQKVYLEILYDLRVKKIRLPAYWDEIEFSNNQYFWNDLDWQIKQASEVQAEIILAIGGRLPRWPECHFPNWTNNFSKEQREAAILIYIEKVIKRYKDKEIIKSWQIENEPFLNHFGNCPSSDSKFLDKEIALAKSLDNRPITITDSGELSLWVSAAKRADIFGTTMYRDTYSQTLKKYIHYPITPAFFRFKKNITSIFANPKEWIVVELQAEPWGPKPYQNLTQAERERTMSLDKFRAIIEFAHQTGFRQFYLWGVEWWYWEKEKNNNPALWQEAKLLFNKQY